MPRSKILVSWSTGKDSLWALRRLLDDPARQVAGLFSVVDSDAARVPMHATHETLLDKQAAAIGLPLHKIFILSDVTNEHYAELMRDFLRAAVARGVDQIAFGDLYLEDLRRYREEKLKGTGIEALFPLWGEPTDCLAEEMIGAGVKAVITSVDSRHLPPEFLGRQWDESFLADRPPSVDPCGENGEFHTFVYDAPLFAAPLDICLGDTTQRNGYYYLAVSPAAPEAASA